MLRAMELALLRAAKWVVIFMAVATAARPDPLLPLLIFAVLVASLEMMLAPWR